MKLNDNAWACIKYSLEAIGERELNPTLVEAVRFRAEADEEYSSDMNEYYGEVQEAGILDTMDRDILYDMVAQELGFKFWPCNGDSDELKEAFEETLDKSFI